jgi:hypothetical protein
MRILFVALLLPLLLCAEQNSHRASWLRDARFGVFIHFLADPALSAEDWSKRIDAFDVQRLAEQLHTARARYLCLTLGQNSGHYLAPNLAYDRFAGSTPSKLSRRDLVADLHAALAPRNIKLLVYLPAGAPDQDPAAMGALLWKKGPHRNLEFQKMWEQVIAEWSTRWGTRIAGWWFDGCYWPNAMYRHAQAPNFGSFAAAARKGNPNAIVAFNRGVIVPINSVSEHEDYTAGEIDDPASLKYSDFWTDVAQPHMLTFLGRAWSQGPPRFSAEDAASITTRLNKAGVAVTWDVPASHAGIIAEDFLSRLVAIGRAVDGL